MQVARVSQQPGRRGKGIKQIVLLREGEKGRSPTCKKAAKIEFAAGAKKQKKKKRQKGRQKMPLQRDSGSGRKPQR